MEGSKTLKSFEDFTNLYEVQKTLGFELIPVGNTQKMLEDERVFSKDETIEKKYQKTKPYFDRLHREFVNESLSGASLKGLNKYYSSLRELKTDKKDKTKQKDFQNQEQALRKQVVALFDTTAKRWATDTYKKTGLKKSDVDIFSEERIFDLLETKYGEEPETTIKDDKGKTISIFSSWKGFSGYFTKFLQTRKNFYKDDGTASALATRIIDQNLKRFCNNLLDFGSIQKKINCTEIEEDFDISLKNFFSLDFYNQCLLQEGIDTYNKILGGEILKNGKKLRGVNELVNEYRQKNKGEKIPFLKLLDKQILSERERFFKEIVDDKELLETLRTFYTNAETKTGIIRDLVENLVRNKKGYSLDEIYISKEAFNTISQKWTDNTEVFEASLYAALKPDKPSGLSFDKKENNYKFPDFFALSHVKNALETIPLQAPIWKSRYYEHKDKDNENVKGFLTGEEAIWEQFLQIFDHEFNRLFREEVSTDTGEIITTGYDVTSKRIKTLLKKDDFSIDANTKAEIKPFADSVLRIYQMAKYFALEKKRAWVENESFSLGDFYTDPETGYLKFYDNAYEEIVQTYNDLRNYLTKKPFSEEKWKLNFENATLANGWDKNKEADNSSVILRKDGTIYLGVMKKGFNKTFDAKNISFPAGETSSGTFEKMEYKYLPAAAKMIPKCSTQLTEVQEHFSKSTKNFEIASKSFVDPLTVSKRIFDLNNTFYDKTDTTRTTANKKNGVKLFQKGYLELSRNTAVYASALEDWINFCKTFLQCYESTQDFELGTLKRTEEYQSLDEFYKDIEKISYKITFAPVSQSYIDKKNLSGELYLFEIHNKDWNLRDGKKKDGTQNLHTQYFESAFSDENITTNFPVKLNGQAELFFRPKTEDAKMEPKKDKKGNVVPDHKRYGKDKILFHCPITLNRATGKTNNFNVRVNDFLANNPDINIIGVDRGEKHLAYYAVIDQKGNTLNDKDGKPATGSLNVLYGIDYGAKLEAKAIDREKARRDWQSVEKIKDLKRGYTSQAIKRLADLAIEHNAIIVFEDLNMRFKQIRGGFEKSAYQQLEKALIDKLSFLVNKREMDPTKAGHLLRAFQLTAPFTTFKDMGKQTGIIFYTQANYTSKIDPVTGWRPNLYFKSTKAENNKKNILKFKDIRFANGRFEFTYDLKDFGNQKEYPRRTEWTLCSCVERFRWNRNLNHNKGGYEHYPNLTDGETNNGNGQGEKAANFRQLFESYGIDIQKDIKSQIGLLEEKGNEKFFSDFIFLWNLLCQIRNSDPNKNGDEGDFILSPVEKNGKFFDSRKADIQNRLPKNGDANGAYNIARKGIIILDRITRHFNENGTCAKMTWGELYISHSDWDDFAQNQGCVR